MMARRHERCGVRAVCVWAVVWLWSASAALPAGAAASLAPYPFVRDLAAGAAGTDGTLGAVELDEDVLARTMPGFSGLRVVDGDGRDVPCVVRERRTARQETVLRPMRFRKIAFDQQGDGGAVITFERADDAVDGELDEIRLNTPLRNFEKEITVRGSDDGQSWTTVAERQPVYDYTRYLDMRQTHVRVARSDYRYYRVGIESINETQRSPLTRIVTDTRDGALFSRVEENALLTQDFRVDRFDFMTAEARMLDDEPVERVYTGSNLLVEADTERRVTVVRFDAGRAPIRRLTLQAGDSNFNRLVTVEGARADGAAAWVRVASGTVRRIRMGHYEHDETAIRFPEPARYDRYRLTISNLDSPPLDLTGVKAEGPVLDVFFAVEPRQAYRLFYGGEAVPKPVYDIASELARVPGANAVRYAAGPAYANPAYRPGAARAALDGRTVMVLAVLVMVGVLSGVIVRAVRQIRAGGVGE
jgi:hypothetical protein